MKEEITTDLQILKRQGNFINNFMPTKPTTDKIDKFLAKITYKTNTQDETKILIALYY